MYPEAVIVKPAKETSYAEILINLKKHVNSEELDVKVRGIRESMNKEILVEVDIAPEERTRLSSLIKDTVPERELARHLLLRTEVEILFVDPIRV